MKYNNDVMFPNEIVNAARMPRMIEFLSNFFQLPMSIKTIAAKGAKTKT
jgi:hypothetical protein